MLINILLGIVLFLIYVVAAVGTWYALVRERKAPTSFTRRVPEGDLAWWGLLPAEEQEEHDNAALDRGEQAEIDARQDAAEAAEFLAHQVQMNALYRP